MPVFSSPGISERVKPKLAIVFAALGAAAVATGFAYAARTKTSARSPNAGIVVIETSLGYQSAAAAGTGMVLTSSGEVLTNNHVIAGATSIKVIVPSNGRTYTADVLGYSVTADTALLKLEGASGLATVTTGNSSKLKRGQSVRAVGNVRAISFRMWSRPLRARSNASSMILRSSPWTLMSI
jgi:S1-C subfamily serine protease